MSLTPAMQKLVDLDKKKAEIKQYFEELQAALEAVSAEVNVGGMFQDPSDGTVFKITEPDGKFVKFEKLGYDRTKREGEARGTLSVKEAKEAGFDVK